MSITRYEASTPTAVDFRAPFVRNSRSICAISAYSCSGRRRRARHCVAMCARTLRAIGHRQSHAGKGENTRGRITRIFFRAKSPRTCAAAASHSMGGSGVPVSNRKSRFDRKCNIARFKSRRSIAASGAIARAASDDLRHDLFEYRTPFVSAAIEAGARSANGLAMLLHQGALAFEIWFGRMRRST